MITRRLLLATPALGLAPAAQATEIALDALLRRYIVPYSDGVNRVRYAAWKAAPADLAVLESWIGQATARRPSSMSRDEAFAYWANLYNALTLKVVLEAYPVRSIRDIRSSGVPFDPKGWFGPWRTRLVTVKGQRLSLDDIEHEVMRPTFRDPLVHYAVNCASIGCPNLPPRAWRAATLAADLAVAAAAYVNHPRGVTVRPDGALRVASIYTWFREDFGGTETGVVAHLRRHANPALAARLPPEARIAEDAYDWTLNDAVSSTG